MCDLIMQENNPVSDNSENKLFVILVVLISINQLQLQWVSVEQFDWQSCSANYSLQLIFHCGCMKICFYAVRHFPTVIPVLMWPVSTPRPFILLDDQCVDFWYITSYRMDFLWWDAHCTLSADFVRQPSKAGTPSFLKPDSPQPSLWMLVCCVLWCDVDMIRRLLQLLTSRKLFWA